MELLELKIDTRTMKNLELLKSNNPPIVYSTRGITIQKTVK